MTEIKPALRGFNPWWYGNYTVTYRPREIYAELQKFLPLRQAIALTGLRRVGKTTIMLKLVEDLIENGNDPKKIIYFSFDEFKDTAIREVIAAYEEMLEMKFGAEKSFLFLDEIQKVKDWENQTKAIYDLYGNSVKIILSGSESLFIRSRPKESLAGRIFTFTVKPLSFKEFLSFTGVSLKPVGLYESQIRKKFHEFTLTQGFPELIGIADSAIIRKYLQEGIIEKVIYRDIP
ncbi:AAA family ATPase, partial [Candidatus Woesearchaeota archaeon]|nr:AAA family ATPase [Candidatus Woesearchaeota archaeon]